MESYDYKIEESPDPSSWTKYLRFIEASSVLLILIFLVFQARQISVLEARVNKLSSGSETGNSSIAKQLADSQANMKLLDAKLSAMESDLKDLREFKQTNSDLQQRIKNLENRKKIP